MFLSKNLQNSRLIEQATFITFGRSNRRTIGYSQQPCRPPNSSGLHHTVWSDSKSTPPTSACVRTRSYPRCIWTALHEHSHPRVDCGPIISNMCQENFQDLSTRSKPMRDNALHLSVDCIVIQVSAAALDATIGRLPPTYRRGVKASY